MPPQAIAAMQPQMAVPVFPTAPPSPLAAPLRHPPSPLTAPPKHDPSPPASPPAPPPPPPPPQPTELAVSDEPLPPPPPPIRKSVSPLLASPTLVSCSIEEPLPPPPPPVRKSVSPLLASPLVVPSSVEEQPSFSTRPLSIGSSQAPIVERRNVQVGSIYIPPVTTAGNSNASSITSTPATASVASPISAQLHKAPMPWMNSQNRNNNSPPPFVQQRIEQARIIPIEREETKSQVRVIPVALEGSRQPTVSTPAPSTPSVVSPPWQNSLEQVIPIHMESATPVRQVPTAAPSPSVQSPHYVYQLQ